MICSGILLMWICLCSMLCVVLVILVMIVVLCFVSVFNRFDLLVLGCLVIIIFIFLCNKLF